MPPNAQTRRRRRPGGDAAPSEIETICCGPDYRANLPPMQGPRGIAPIADELLRAICWAAAKSGLSSRARSLARHELVIETERRVDVAA